MKTKDFLRRVQQHGPEADQDTALEAAKATIEVLSYHLPTEQVRRMATQLPGELQASAQVGGVEFLSGESPTGVDAFYGQIANRADLDFDLAAQYAHATILALQQAIHDGELSGVTLDLPTGLSDLLSED